MADDVFTHEEVLALANAFPIASAKTLLSAAHFPPWAVPESGFANSREFWVKVTEQLAAGVMLDGRRRILVEARRVYPWSKTIPELPLTDAAVPAGVDTAHAAPVATPAGTPSTLVTIDGSHGIVIGEDNVQVNIVMPDSGRRATVMGRASEPTTPDIGSLLGREFRRQAAQPLGCRARRDDLRKNRTSCSGLARSASCGAGRVRRALAQGIHD